MKPYLLVSGAMYLLLVVAHVARVISEGPSVTGSPTFVVTSIAAVLMTVWSWRLLRKMRRETAV